jgi:hypothetical protein
VFAAALLLGGLLLGLPIYVTGRRAGVKFPAAEAVIWTSLLAVAVVVFVLTTRPAFGAVNAVTTEDIRRHGGTWPYPLELVWGVRCAVVFCAVAGASSMLVNGGSRRPLARAWRAALLSVSVAMSLGGAMLLFALGGPMVWRLIPLDVAGVAAAAFVPGCVAGAGIIAARRLTLGNSPAPRRPAAD